MILKLLFLRIDGRINILGLGISSGDTLAVCFNSRKIYLTYQMTCYPELQNIIWVNSRPRLQSWGHSYWSPQKYAFLLHPQFHIFYCIHLINDFEFLCYAFIHPVINSMAQLYSSNGCIISFLSCNFQNKNILMTRVLVEREMVLKLQNMDMDV